MARSHAYTCFIDAVKVDRSFVQEIESNKKNQNLVKANLSLAKTLEIDLVVE